MVSQKKLEPVRARAGRPLYVLVRDAIHDAVDSGLYPPGTRIPSTHQLSLQLKVSLVTAHRALQELVGRGVLQRSQGRGTFVHEKYAQRRQSPCQLRVGLVLRADAHLVENVQGHILEGIRLASQAQGVDLILLHVIEDLRNECDGFLFVTPRPDELDEQLLQMRRRTPAMIIGARPGNGAIRSVYVDDAGLARRALGHLVSLGHRRVGFVGASDDTASGRERWNGFVDAAQQHGIVPRDQDVVRALSWRLDDREQAALTRSLADVQRPTAVFAAGYEFALDAYASAARAKLSVPHELSVIGVDDPPSAAHLAPPLTTFSQPLIELGHLGAKLLAQHIRDRDRVAPTARALEAKLVERCSTAPLQPEPPQN